MTLNLTGQKFGRLIAINPSQVKHKTGRIQWECQCDCGKKTNVLTSQLVRGNTTSCGCKQKENLATGRRLPKHKLSYPPTPEPYPQKAAELFAKHHYLIDRVLRQEGNLPNLEDLATDLLYRACWISVYRQNIGKQIANNEAYLWSWLMLGRVKKKLSRKSNATIKTENSTGGQMTKISESTLHVPHLS